MFKFLYTRGTIGAALILVMFNSCTERIDIDLGSTYTRAVIFGSITTDTTAHRVMVSKTADYFNDLPPQGISGATVWVWDGISRIDYTENPARPGEYMSPEGTYGVASRTYTLHVDDVDLLDDGNYNSYEACSTLQLPVSIDSIQVDYRLQWQGWVVQAYAKDPAQTKDYYKFLVYVNDELITDSLRNIQWTDDTFFNGSYTNGVVVHYFSEEDAELKTGDKVSVALCSISEDYYKFLSEAQTTSRRSAPLFSGPPANPRTNLSNNAIGYFAAYSIARATSYASKK